MDLRCKGLCDYTWWQSKSLADQGHKDSEFHLFLRSKGKKGVKLFVEWVELQDSEK